MTPEQVLALKPKVLTQAQRESYFNDGFVLVERAIGDDWIRKLRAATDELVESSRKVTKSDPVFDLEPAHVHPMLEDAVECERVVRAGGEADAKSHQPSMLATTRPAATIASCTRQPDISRCPATFETPRTIVRGTSQRVAARATA